MQLKNSLVNSVVLLLLSFQAKADLQPVTLSTTEKLPAPRWMFDSKEKGRTSGLARELEEVKRAQLNGKFRRCFQQALPLYGRSSSLGPWVAVTELTCLRRSVNEGDATADFLATALNRIEAKGDWLSRGAQKQSLRQEVIEGRLVLIGQDFRRQRQRAWESIDRLMQIEDWMTVEQRAKLFRQAGELAFIEQKMKAAKSFVLQSLSLVESTELRDKLSAIEKALKDENKSEKVATKKVKEKEEKEEKEAKEDDGEEEIETKTVSEPTPEVVAMEASPEEEKLYTSIKTSLKGGALLSAVEDSVDLINKFPGGKRAQWAGDQILAAFLRNSTDQSRSFFSEQSRILRQMKKVDGLRQQEWASRMFDRGHYYASKELALSAAAKLKPALRTRKILMLAGEAALADGDIRKAGDVFRKVAIEHSGSNEALHATFRAGLCHYRLKEYEKAAAFFDKLLVVEDTQNLELSARYWLWRSLQAGKSSRSDRVRDDLIEAFPLSYYGLRAMAEKNEGLLKLPQEDKEKKSVKVWLTSHQRQVWDNFFLLLRSGWLEEARLELATLAPAFNKEDSFLVAKVWAAALDYRQATTLAGDAVEMKNRMENLSYIHLTYPEEFKKIIETEAKVREVPTQLVQSLIKQESAFYTTAISRARAMGLMQLMGPTAKEAAENIGLKSFDAAKDLENPEINIRLGTFYLKQLLTQFSGHVPLALAAYNAGPTRLRRWLEPRQLQEKLLKSPTSEPEQELWIDEMPWAETRFYVKSILRNYIVYGLLDKGRVELADPLWK